MFFNLFIILGVLSCEVYAHVCYVYQEPMGRGHGRLPRWWVSETNPCECTEMRLGGRNMVSYNRPYDQVTFLINGVLISTDPKEIQDFWGCEQISVSGSAENSMSAEQERSRSWTWYRPRTWRWGR
ncbi:uncharacterized protein LOC117298019 [Asterias rubens]|uniref:uncharacterized protein LOC117298019 n=1 Tax=Asterias rubens TaxID=7604 RepID=UPI001454EEC5|nr:uncharacterized protein LOC117298019 [Asterias rubens]